jgi:hypothetical protein
MDVLELAFEFCLPLPSTHQDGCHKQFKSNLRSCCGKLTTPCHFSFVNLSCKNDEDHVKGTFARCIHRFSNHVLLGPVRTVK